MVLRQSRRASTTCDETLFPANGLAPLHISTKMQPKLQRRIQRYGWDLAASDYEPLWRTQLASAQKELLALARLAPGERVLDVACGTGIVTLNAARAAAMHPPLVRQTEGNRPGLHGNFCDSANACGAPLRTASTYSAV